MEVNDPLQYLQWGVTNAIRSGDASVITAETLNRPRTSTFSTRYPVACGRKASQYTLRGNNLLQDSKLTTLVTAPTITIGRKRNEVLIGVWCSMFSKYSALKYW